MESRIFKIKFPIQCRFDLAKTHFSSQRNVKHMRYGQSIKFSCQLCRGFESQSVEMFAASGFEWLAVINRVFGTYTACVLMVVLRSTLTFNERGLCEWSDSDLKKFWYLIFSFDLLHIWRTKKVVLFQTECNIAQMETFWWNKTVDALLLTMWKCKLILVKLML